MRHQKPLKIDFNNDYPCPCRRKGKLTHIILTEAFGCDRCQQIFVVDEKGQFIEQLSSSYPYKRAWRWTGYRWVMTRHGLGSSYLPVALCLIFIIMIIGLLLLLRSLDGQNIIFWTGIAVALVALPAIVFWLAYRR